MTLPTPKHQFNFDEGSGTQAVDSAGGARMTMDRSSFHSTQWKTGLRFNPVDGARVVTSNVPDRPPPWTAGLWLLREAKSTSSTLFCTDDSSIKLEQWNANNLVGFTNYSFGVPGVGGDYHFGYETPIGKWVHLAFVATNQEIKLYVDGVLQNTNPRPVIFGMKWVGSSHGWHEFGQMIIDELKIFDEALNDQQVQELAGKTPKIVVSLDNKAVASGGLLDLGTIANGQSKAVPLSIKNNGKVRLTYSIASADASGAFTVPVETNKSLEPTAPGHDYTVAFKSNKAGKCEATITIKSDDPDAPSFTYTVIATGQDAAPPKPPQPQPLPQLNLGEPAGYCVVQFPRGGYDPTPGRPVWKLPPGPAGLHIYDQTGSRLIKNGETLHPLAGPHPSVIAAEVMVMNTSIINLARRQQPRSLLVKRFYIEQGDTIFTVTPGSGGGNGSYSTSDPRPVQFDVGYTLFVTNATRQNDSWVLGAQSNCQLVIAVRFNPSYPWNAPYPVTHRLIIETDDPGAPVFAATLDYRPR